MSETIRRGNRGRSYGQRSGNDRPDTMGTNVYSSKDQQSMHKSLNGEFILYQVLLQRLLDDHEDLPDEARQGLVKYFEPEDSTDEKVMKEFDEEYRSEKAIHWYTRETCIYRTLNKALRIQNIDDVSAFTKFIRDLRKQLIEENAKFVKQQKSSILTVYRGQLISKDEINRLKSSVRGLISMNSFLSTSTNKEKALEFARSRQPPNDELTRILLEIQVNIRSPSRPFADIKHLSAFAEEEEILFMFGCVFRLNKISYDEKDDLWRGTFSLCDDNDPDMKEFLSNLQGEFSGKNRLVSLGQYLIQMQKYEEAQNHYEHLINNHLINDRIDLADCHLGLARALRLKAHINAAMDNVQKAYNYLLENPSTREHRLVSECYNELGSIYGDSKNYPLAFEYYDKALSMRNNSPSTTYLGLGKIHYHMKNYYLAEDFYRKALEKSNPNEISVQTNLSIELGRVYIARNEKDRASKMFDQVIQSQKKTFGEEHPDLSYAYSAISSIHSNSNNNEKTLEYLEKSYQLQSKTLPSNHQDFAQTFQSFATFYEKSGDDLKALENYHKLIENLLKSLSWSHPKVTEGYLNIGQIHWRRKEYDQALIYFHKVFDAELDRRKVGDPSLSRASRDLADLYHEKGDRDSALKFYLHCLNNELQNKFPEDFSLIDLYRIISKLFYQKRQLAEALFYSNRLLDCYLKKDPNNEKEIEEIYQMIRKIYLKKEKFDQNLSVHQQTNSNGEEKNHQEIINRFHSIDHLHFGKKHLDQAQEYFTNHLQKELKATNSNIDSLSDFNQILGEISFEKKDFPQALTFYLQLFELKLKKKLVDSPSLEEIYRAIATIYLKMNLFDYSLIYFHRLIDCQKKKYSNLNHPSISRSYRSIGKIFLGKHFREEFSRHYYHFLHHHAKSNGPSYSPELMNRMKISSFDFEKTHLNETILFFQNSFQQNSFKHFDQEQLIIILFHLNAEKFDFQQSLAYLQQLVHLQSRRSSPNDRNILALTYAYLGQCYSDQSLFDQALNYFRLALNTLQKKNSSLQQPSLEQFLRHRIREILSPNAL